MVEEEVKQKKKKTAEQLREQTGRILTYRYSTQKESVSKSFIARALCLEFSHLYEAFKGKRTLNKERFKLFMQITAH
jgi:hypothetical protein